jgi:chromosome partitioning protein
MIVVVGGIKGGSGKTTAATNLAVLRAAAGFDVLLVDADEQESCYSFAQVRSETRPTDSLSCIKLTGPPVGREVRKLATKYHDIVIDTGGRDTASQRAALSVADVALVPFKPRSLDVWTLGQAAQMMEEAKSINTQLHAATFLNMADSRGSDNNEASEILRETDAFVFSGISLGHRKAFSNAAANGLSVSELSPVDVKAEQEIRALYTYVFNTSHIAKAYADDMQKAEATK